MRLNLKKARCDNRSQAIFLIIMGMAVCGVILYEILSQSLQKSDFIVMGAFLCSAVMLLTGIWLLLNHKKSIVAINKNGWKYRLFMKKNKYLFILLAGCSQALFVAFIMLVLYILGLLQWHDSLSAKEILWLAAFAIFLIALSGYIDYRKYASMKFEGDTENEQIKP